MNEESLFAAALEKDDPAERQAFLNAVCAGQEALRRRLERLLAVNENGTGIFERWPDTQRPEPSLAPGRVFASRFKLREKLGEGGMGEVWVADQLEPVKRRVALKVVRAGFDSERMLSRFEQERQALALFDHPNIAKVLDAGVDEVGRPFFAMELIRGVPITRYCDDARLTLRQRLELFIPICHAVQHAHQKGVIHRDLKPSNILIGLYDGVAMPKVIDFGVAKATGPRLTENTVYTEIGALIGTLEYMSPEQAEMNNVDIDTRADIYALGAVLYELLTGTVPFSRRELQTAAFPEMLRIIREVEPPRPSARLTASEALAAVAVSRQIEAKKLIAFVRGELDWIVLKTLDKDRNRRYETANELALDLRRYLADEPVVACPPSLAYRIRKLVRRHKGPVLAALLVALALVGGMIGTTWSMMRATDAEDAARLEAGQKEAALKAAQQSELDAREQLFQALLNQARAGRFSRQPGQRLDTLAAIAKAARIRPDDRLRDEAIAAMALPDIYTVPAWRGHAPGAAEVAYGRSYGIWARNDDQISVSIRSIPDDREIRRVTSGPLVGKCLHFSPDERFLVAIAQRGRIFKMWRVADGQPLFVDKLHGCRAYAFSSDGKRVAVDQKGFIHCFDIDTEKELKRYPIPDLVQSMAFNADDSRLAVGYLERRHVTVTDTATGNTVVQVPPGSMGGQIVAWHPSRDLLAIGGDDALIHVWNMAVRRRLFTLEGHAQNLLHLTFHPDGDLLASQGWDGQLLLWDINSGHRLMRYTTVSVPEFSRDGRLLGVTWHGDQAYFVEVTPSREYFTLANNAASRTPTGNADISTDGRLLAVGFDGGAGLWDLHSRRQWDKLSDASPFVFLEAAQNGPPWTLFTAGSSGVQRRSITVDPLNKTRLLIGTPLQLSPHSRAHFARSPEGETLLAATKEGAPSLILDPKTGAVRQEIGRHPQGEVFALSSDGHWAASCGWHSDRVRLWKIAKNELVDEWTLGNRTTVFFSPDSRTLIISRGDEFSFRDIQKRDLIHPLPREVSQFPGWVAFSRDGRHMALEMAPGIIHLIDYATMRTLARLEDPHGDRATWQGFTPDGQKLVTASRYANSIHVWDLLAIRQHLKTLNLDWN